MIHLLKIPEQTYDEEQAFLDALDKYQRRYLSKYNCGACSKSLDKPCCEIYLDDTMVCSEAVRIKRIEKCLKDYKPRPNRRKA